jgi:flagellar biosynthetic protein FlhB
LTESTAQDKTEPATAKRKADSKKKGQVPRSKELNTVTSLMMAGTGMIIFGPQIVRDINLSLVEGLSFGREEAFSDSILGIHMFDAVLGFMSLLSPLFALLACAALISPMSLGGWVFSGSQLLPKMERISPLKGMGRIFSSKSLMELVKAIGKFVLVAATTIFVIRLNIEDIWLIPMMPFADALDSTGEMFIWSFLGFSSVLIVVAFVDIPFQLWSFAKETKMSKQEVKDESKETDGKPEIKSAIRERQQEISRRRMMAEVPTADVVITNPTHYAIALRYQQSGTGAPKVVAKGQGLIAAKIREVAKEHNVTLFAAPALARALYSSTDLNQEIPGNLFLAVAQVLAYVFQLKRVVGKPGARPKPPKGISVPEEYVSADKFRGRS